MPGPVGAPGPQGSMGEPGPLGPMGFTGTEKNSESQQLSTFANNLLHVLLLLDLPHGRRFCVYMYLSLSLFLSLSPYIYIISIYIYI